MVIEYRFGNDLNLDQVIELYHASTLGTRRPWMIGKSCRR